MEKCKDLFDKIIAKLDKCSSLEDYYNLLKRDNYEYLFCESYLNNEKETYTYKSFFEKVDVVAAFFQKELAEIPKKSWIGIKLPNHPYYLAVCFALMRNDFNVLLLDDKGSNYYFDYVIENSNLRAVIAEDTFENKNVKFINFQDAINFKAEVDNTTCENFSNKLAICTSGTTGYYNIIVLNGAQIIHQIKSLFKVLKNSPVEEDLVENSTKLLIFLPLHHVFGLMSLLFYSSIGVTNVMCKQTLSSFMSTMKFAQINWVAAVPLVWESMIKFIKGKYHIVNEINIRKVLGDNLSFCFSGGASVSPHTLKLFNDSKIEICNIYGMTEAGGMITLNPGKTEEDRTDGSIGTINNSSCKIRILSSPGEIVRDGVGELIVSGDGIYTSILKDGKEVYRDLSELDGFIRTGDLVKVQDEKIYLIDRIKDVIINSSGENISTAELEKYFAPSLDNTHFTILGIDDYPTIVIFIKDKSKLKADRKVLTEKIIERNKDLPLNKKIVSIYFTSVPFPTTSALKIKKYELRNQIKLCPENYEVVNLMNKSKNSISSIMADLKKFFSTYLNISSDEISSEARVIEDLSVNSLIIAELFIHVEEKYKVSIDKEFLEKETLTVTDIAKMIYEKL